jgi:hypothetical protein
MADPRSRGAGVPQWSVRPARVSDAIGPWRSIGDRASRRLGSTRSAPQVTFIGTSSCGAPCPEVSRTCDDDEVCPAHAAQDPA